MESEGHVAIVDDDPGIRELVAEHLERYGFRTTAAASAAEYRRLAAGARFDLLVLDVMMPGEDGLSLCRDVRAGSALPIILLTALGEESDRIVGLELGADDYLVKPFHPRELVARIRAVLRRLHALPPMAEAPGALARFDGRTFDPLRRTLTNADGLEVALSTAEAKLLRALLERRGSVLTREQLLDITRSRSNDVFDRSVDNQISRLRRKIEPDPKRPTTIVTYRGGGYGFVPEVEWI